MDGLTAVLVVVLLAGLAGTAISAALIALDPIRAVQDERFFDGGERRWSNLGSFPSEVHRVYRHPRMVQVDGWRLRHLGYEEEARGMVRGAWGGRLAGGRPAGELPSELVGIAAEALAKLGTKTASDVSESGIDEKEDVTTARHALRDLAYLLQRERQPSLWVDCVHHVSNGLTRTALLLPRLMR
jgi:hypothetical protein